MKKNNVNLAVKEYNSTLIMKLNFRNIAPIIVSGVLFLSCGDQQGNDKNEIDQEILDSKNALNTDFDGKIFSIPSPIQMALLLKETNAPFNEKLLNDTKNSSNYSTEYKQALNLGVYGTDLGYVSVNGQNSISLNCLSAVESLTNKLGLDGVFDKSFLSRFEKNKTQEDSILVIVSEVFRNGDNFLKREKRKHTSALILTGGWIESIYYACEINKLNSSQKIVDRIAEQQQTLITIIDILTEYNNNHENDALITSLKDLRTSFDSIAIEYTFVKPKTNAAKKITTLQHVTTVEASQKTISEIALKISTIRKTIIN